VVEDDDFLVLIHRNDGIQRGIKYVADLLLTLMQEGFCLFFVRVKSLLVFLWFEAGLFPV